jgi:hypothetical protein
MKKTFPVFMIITMVILFFSPTYPTLPVLSNKGQQVISYSINVVEVPEGTEYRFIKDHHHYMTLIDHQGTFAFRPHPGLDINGWGSTWYAQPFLPGAILTHTIIEAATADSSGIHIRAHGEVSKGQNDSYGSWAARLDFTYDGSAKLVTGNGEYTISLSNILSADDGGDLNLYKISSNYLDDVPLLSGETGDTGDMKVAEVSGDTVSLTWAPPDLPAHFPTDETNSLGIKVLGDYNDVDTKAQGYAPIEPACKPSLHVVLASQKPSARMRFGAIYTLADKAKFWVDNVGITPLIYHTSPETEFAFNVHFESLALTGCCNGITTSLNTGRPPLTVHLQVDTENATKMKANWGDGGEQEYQPGIFDTYYTFLSPGPRDITVWVFGQGEWRTAESCKTTIAVKHALFLPSISR